MSGIQSDVSNLAHLDRFYATVKEQKGRIDILFANTGVGELAPLEASTETHFDKTFGIDVRRERASVHRAKSTATISRRWFDYFERLDRCI